MGSEEMTTSVENVQEMVRKNPSSVPERFLIINNDDNPNISPVSSDVPVIDLSSVCDGNEDEIKKLDCACADWGFFQIINHGIAEEVLHGMKNTAAEFFKLPLEEKNKYPPKDIQGYGQAQSFLTSKEQKLDWEDVLMLFIYPLSYRKLDYWPTSPPELKDVIQTYSAEVHKVGERLLRVLSVMMGMDKDTLLEMHKEVMHALRVNYYPPCPMPERVLGVSAHSDSTSLTILMQDDDITALQIRRDDGWLPIKPIPNALVVNIGDVIEIWSNGKYRSIEHRAITNKYKARTSFASFLTPTPDVELEPLDQMVNPLNPQKLYKKIKYYDYVSGSLEKKLETKPLRKDAN
ncbi:hypothetical protein AQUCO_00300126v1 [Aquilegia coerulea]|uniref:Fe2OG dioxygenase domain-containing protein n=1 Tax=Aquilegia coerulea TaxID=218851 RepID=A0A2G5EXH2_AQUCA|nr:hypothetical protein AQUCO_00300126v1 [Aquilegia coerulea]